MPFERLKGFVADYVLHFAGVLLCNITAYAQFCQRLGQNRMALINLFCKLKSAFCQLQKAVFAGNAEFIAKTAFGDNAQTVIYCYKGAGAESYAAENGMSYRYFGDLDSDGSFTATDLSLLKRLLLNSDSAFDTTASDVNADSRVDILDLVRLKNLAAKA